MFCGVNPSRFVPPDDFNLALLTLELEFVKKGTKDEQVGDSPLFFFNAYALLSIYTALIVESNLTDLVTWFMIGNELLMFR